MLIGDGVTPYVALRTLPPGGAERGATHGATHGATDGATDGATHGAPHGATTRAPARGGDGCCHRFLRWASCGLCGRGGGSGRTILLNASRPTLGRRFPRNRVLNSKYTLITFIPKVLYEQFRYFFNLYFLLVACSQFFPPLQIGESTHTATLSDPYSHPH